MTGTTVAPELIAEAAALILGGVPVVVPTETVYGLAADATNGHAIARVYEAKGRPSFNPLIIHVEHLAAAEAIGVLGPVERRLAEAHWPGPLTLVVPLRPDARIASLALAGLDTVAIRVPAHPVMQALLHATGRPLAAPSANASGGVSPTRVEHVRASLGDRVAMVLDGGATAIGVESTIVAVEDGAPRLLRPGPVLTELAPSPQTGIRAPGQLQRHYAPGKPVRLNATAAEPDEWLIGFGVVAGNATLSPSGDLAEAAASLFDCLHLAAAANSARIAVAPVPDRGLGRAINDRLRRAAA